MGRPDTFELDLEPPRSQRLAAFCAAATFAILAALAFREGWQLGQRGPFLYARTLLQLVQGGVLYRVVLRVEDGWLEVVTAWEGTPRAAAGPSGACAFRWPRWPWSGSARCSPCRIPRPA